jgi:hypothetical protein
MLFRRIAVEVFDSGCFCSNQQQPLGESVMRIQLLNACGWQVRQGAGLCWRQASCVLYGYSAPLRLVCTVTGCCAVP